MIHWLDFRLDAFFGPELTEFVSDGSLENYRTKGRESGLGEQDVSSGEIQETGQVLRSARMVDYAGSDSIRRGAELSFGPSPVVSHMEVGPTALDVSLRGKGGGNE